MKILKALACHIGLLLAGFLAAGADAAAQGRLILDTVPDTQETARPRDKASLKAGNPPGSDTARLARTNDSLLEDAPKEFKLKQQFIPDPKRALWLSLILPGAGQIYNRKFWKLPIIYGGFLGCTYALMWNQQMYRDYSQAYLDIMDEDPTTDSYMDMLPPRYDLTGREEQIRQLLRNRRDRYRRYRDLSVFCFVGVYLISVIDAYVDAQLSVFDISPDLSMRLQPAVIESNMAGKKAQTSYGIGCSLNF